MSEIAVWGLWESRGGDDPRVRLPAPPTLDERMQQQLNAVFGLMEAWEEGTSTRTMRMVCGDVPQVPNRFAWGSGLEVNLPSAPIWRIFPRTIIQHDHVYRCEE